MNLKGLVYFIVISLFLVPGVLGVYEDYVNFYDISKQNETFRASYDFDFRGNFTQEDYFVVQYSHNDGEFQEFCRKQIKSSSSSVFKKITCEFDSQGEGNYVLRAKVTSPDTTKYQFESQFYESKKAYGYYSFENLGENSTLVRMHLEGNLTNARVYSDIPSEVISLLTPENKDSLVVSNKSYEIIEQNPLIAWNVDRIPQDVEYEVKKDISKSEQQDFSMVIEESTTFSVLKYLAGFGILVILFLIGLPLFKHKK